MRNGFFKVIKTPAGFGVAIYAPKDGGEPVRAQELVNYLDMNGLTNYEPGKVTEAIKTLKDEVIELGTGECPPIRENYNFTVSEDNMKAIARFTPPSETGERMTVDEFLKDMAFRMIKFGIQTELLQKLFASGGIYSTDIVVAKGKAPRHGTDARIEYFFNTDLRAKPEVNEDGTVDYFHLGIVNILVDHRRIHFTPAASKKVVVGCGRDRNAETTHRDYRCDFFIHSHSLFIC